MTKIEDEVQKIIEGLRKVGAATISDVARELDIRPDQASYLIKLMEKEEIIKIQDKGICKIITLKRK